MDFTVSSFLSSFIWGNILIITLVFLFARNYFVLQKHINYLIFFSLIIIIRFLIPCEFSFAIEIPLQHYMPTLLDILNTPIFNSQNFNISLVHILLILWGSGAIIYLLKFINRCRHFYQLIHVLDKISDSPRIDHIIEALRAKSKKYSKYKNIKIIQNSIISSPSVTGILNPIILIPMKEFSDDELMYILSHELEHCNHHDIIIQLLFELFCAIYWWNPCVYVLKKRFATLLEIRVDLSLISTMNKASQVAYLECLFRVSKFNNKPKSNMVLGFSIQGSSVLEKRFYYMINPIPEKKRYYTIFLLIFFSPSVLFYLFLNLILLIPINWKIHMQVFQILGI